jgi:short-subunit dehydrogenase
MSRKGFTQADVPDQSGKCVVVTGANTGIGFETSRVLARRGARVLLACRDQSKAEAAMARIKQESPKADLEFLPLDLADLDSVQRAADLAAEEARIDVLVNNAGVLMPPLRLSSAERRITAVGCHPGAAATDIGQRRSVRIRRIEIRRKTRRRADSWR